MAKGSLSPDSQPTIDCQDIALIRSRGKVKVDGRIRQGCQHKMPPFILVVTNPHLLMTLTSRCRLPYAEAAICGLDVNPLSPPVNSSDS